MYTIAGVGSRDGFIRLAVCALLVGSLAHAADPSDPQVVDRSVAVVDGELITLSELTFEAQVALVEAGADPAQVQALDLSTLRSALDLAIAQRLEVAEAERLRAFPMDEAEVAGRLKRFAAHFKDERAFERFLGREEMDQGQLAVVLARELRAEKVLDSKVRLRAQVSESELRVYYANHAAQLGVPFNQARSEIREKLIQQKYAKLAQAEVAQLRASGGVRLLAPWARGKRT